MAPIFFFSFLLISHLYFWGHLRENTAEDLLITDFLLWKWWCPWYTKMNLSKIFCTSPWYFRSTRDRKKKEKETGIVQLYMCSDPCLSLTLPQYCISLCLLTEKLQKKDWGILPYYSRLEFFFFLDWHISRTEVLLGSPDEDRSQWHLRLFTWEGIQGLLIFLYFIVKTRKIK